jgi:hypothetical protein
VCGVFSLWTEWRGGLLRWGMRPAAVGRGNVGSSCMSDSWQFSGLHIRRERLHACLHQATFHNTDEHYISITYWQDP